MKGKSRATVKKHLPSQSLQTADCPRFAQNSYQDVVDPKAGGFDEILKDPEQPILCVSEAIPHQGNSAAKDSSEPPGKDQAPVPTASGTFPPIPRDPVLPQQTC